MGERSGRRGRWLTILVVGLAVPAIFIFGFVAGRVGQSSTSTRRTGSVDEAMQRILERADTDVGERELSEAAIRGMLGALDDDYATYFGPADFDEFQRLLEGRYTGVGLWLRRTAGATSVVSVLPGSPAARAGLRVGDRIVSVAGVDVGRRELGDVVAAMRGEPGTSVVLGIVRDGRPTAVRLERSEVASSDVLVDEPADNVGRIRVAAFTRGVGRAVRAHATRLRAERVDGIVLDLRGNPGGLLHEAVEAASAFLDGGTVVSYRGRGVEPQLFTAARGGDVVTSLVVLVDGGTASAAEVLAGALQDRGRAVVVGSTTYGKGSVQQPVRLSDGSAVEFTVARYVTPNGRSLDGVGISPDIDVLSTADGGSALRRGVEVIRGILAGTPPARG